MVQKIIEKTTEHKQFIVCFGLGGASVLTFPVVLDVLLRILSN